MNNIQVIRLGVTVVNGSVVISSGIDLIGSSFFSISRSLSLSSSKSSGGFGVVEDVVVDDGIVVDDFDGGVAETFGGGGGGLADGLTVLHIGG